MKKHAYFSDEYSVDDLGNVYGKNGKVLKPSINPGGYQIINYMKDGKSHGASVHRTVAMAFIPNPDGKSQINHIDGDKTNNTVSNLEWVTGKENMQHAINQLGFSPNATKKKAVCGVKGDEIVKFDSVREAARWFEKKYGIKHGLVEVWRVLNGRRKSSHGYKWFYTG